MFFYDLRMAIRGIRRNPVLSTLMVAAIGIGIGVCMTAITVYYLMSADPIPQKSDSLFAVQLNSWEAPGPYDINDPTRMSELLTYTDAKNLLAAGKATRQVAMYRSGATLEPENPDINPMLSLIRFTSGDFFEMFDVPFLYGSGWGADADRDSAAVAVLSFEMNQQLFGGEDSVGKTISLDSRNFRVVGVLEHWEPTPRFYASFNGAFGDTEDVLMPFALNESWEMQTFGNVNCWGDDPIDSFTDFLNSECVWVEYWAELPTAADQEQYQAWLQGYIEEQKRLGRFPIQGAAAEIHDVMDWLDYNRVVSTDFKVLIGLAFMFLAVCLLNTIALLLAKISGDAARVGLFRALGASKSEIFRQNLVEVGMIGVAGGAFGLALALLGLWGVRVVNLGHYDRLATLDGTLVALAILISIVTALIAGLYPTWRICQISPATYLKTQ